MTAGCEQLEELEEGDDQSSSHGGIDIHIGLSYVHIGLSYVSVRQIVCHTTGGKDAWARMTSKDELRNGVTARHPYGRRHTDAQ
jgi:hypothetical protein